MLGLFDAEQVTTVARHGVDRIRSGPDQTCDAVDALCAPWLAPGHVDMNVNVGAAGAISPAFAAGSRIGLDDAQVSGNAVGRQIGQ
jgi:hypothetical protein